MPAPLTLNPLSSSAACTCAAVAPPEPTPEFVTGDPLVEFSRYAKPVAPAADLAVAEPASRLACVAECPEAVSTPALFATASTPCPKDIGVRFARLIKTTGAGAEASEA